MENSDLKLRIGVDIGGTFTDLIMVDDEGRLTVAKVPSTPDDPSRGVLAAIERSAEQIGTSVGELLSRCQLFVHGSTIATNTMLEGKGARVGMLTTSGFRDSLEIRRGAREDSWDHRTPFAPVLVPRHLRLGVTERIDRDGEVLSEIDSGELDEHAARFDAEGVDSIAVCLLNSFVNPAHEQQIRETLSARLPTTPVSLSSEVAPVMGEYERGSTAVINAYLAPQVLPYLQKLDAMLGEQGLDRPVLLMQSNAGVSSVEQVSPRPATLLLSGPAAAHGSLELIARQCGNDNLISMEIGGTSCDVVMMNAGEVGLRDESLIAGYHVALPSIDVHTVGAGGGTVAAVDSGGMLKVGPRGAGADPGPVCYGLGGVEPTVTDALLVLGRLAARRYADGAVNLDLSAAQNALHTRLAEPLGISIEEAAVGVISILEQNVLHAVQRISIERGLDPSPCTLVAAGGAGPMHGAAVARALGCKQVFVPRQAGAYCALGMLNTDVRHDVMRVLIDDLDGVGDDLLEHEFGLLERRAGQLIEREGFGPERRRVERFLGLHYAGQQSSIRVSAEDLDRARLRAEFEALHQRMFGHIQPGGFIEITSLNVSGIGAIPRLEPTRDPREVGTLTADEVRLVFAGHEQGMLDTPVYIGSALGPDVEIAGPVLIEEQTTTIYVGPGDTVRVDAYGNYVIEVEQP